MLKLDIKERKTYHVDWLTYSWAREKGLCGLDEICKQTYGKDITFGTSNDTDYSIDVEKKALPDYDQETVDDCVATGFIQEYDLNILMNDLCNRDAIPPGHYVVTVSW